MFNLCGTEKASIVDLQVHSHGGMKACMIEHL